MGVVKGVAAKKTATTKKTMEKAPSWVNFSVIDANNKENALGRGIPVSLDSKALRSLHNAEIAHREAYDEMIKKLPKGAPVPEYKPKQFRFVGYVTITPDNADEDLAL